MFFRFFVLLIASASTLFSATFNVGTTAELRTALINAGLNKEDNIIYLKSGIYHTTDDSKGVLEYNSTLLNKQLSVIGIGNVVISGSNQTKILSFEQNETGKLFIKNLTLTESNDTALKILDGNSIITDSNISYNTIYNKATIFIGSSKNIEINNSLISYNAGEILFKGNAPYSNSYLKFNNNIYERNVGGIYTLYINNINIINSIFTNNYGGIFKSEAWPDEISSYQTSFLVDKSIFNSFGLNIYKFFNVKISNSTFSSNQYTAFTSNMSYSPNYNLDLAKEPTQPVIINSKFIGNKKAINIVSDRVSSYSRLYKPLQIINSVFQDNGESNSTKGMIYANSMEIVNSVFTNNKSLNGVIQSNQINLSSEENLSSMSSKMKSKLSQRFSVVNSIFHDNQGGDLYIDGNLTDAIAPILFNNYIDTSKLIDPYSGYFNIEPTDSAPFNTSDFSLPENSPLRSAGATSSELTSYGADNSLIEAVKSIENNLSNSINIGLQNNISSDETKTYLTLKTGWNLVAFDATLVSLSKTIPVVYQYSAGKWLAYSPNGTYTKSISTYKLGSVPATISSKNGTWIKVNSDLNISVSAVPVVNNSSLPETVPNAPDLNFAGVSGWNLLGTSKTVSAKQFYCSTGTKNIMWKLVNGVWAMYSDNIDVSQVPNTFPNNQCLRRLLA